MSRSRGVPGRALSGIMARITARITQPGELVPLVPRRHLEDRDRLIAATSHDMVNALSSIIGYLELLEDEPASDRSREVQRHLRVLATRVMLMSEDLLVDGTEDAQVSITISTLDVRAELETCREAFPGLEIIISSDEGLLLDADSLRLQQVLGNLVRNAQKYGRPPVRLSATSTLGGGTRIVVTDEGDGVPTDFVPHLFERHSRASRTQVSGTGLGLAVARSLTRLQGGQLTYESAPHQFVLTFPAHSPG